MDAWLEFGRGPLFRFCFALMVLGLLRLLILTAVNMVSAYRSSSDKILPWKDMTLKTLGWLAPFGKLWTKRPIYSLISFLFHIGLLLVPLFLGAHVLLWKGSFGFAWPALPQNVADGLTLLMIVSAMGLLAGRVFHQGARSLSRKQDYFWPALLMIPFVTGYLCANVTLAADTYQQLMVTHIYAANLIMILIPFTKIAHCVLLPLSQYVTGLAWKFPAGAGDRVAETLGYASRPTWVERPRVALDPTTSPTEEA